ncbi:MAG: ribonuclease E/G [Rhodobacteraceae bacterium]|nr:ribonuclease E/G [Paracoccaceae bacterium]
MTDTFPAPDQIIVTRGPGETRAALLAQKQLIEIVHMRDVDAQPGAHFRGRIGKPSGEANGVFVELGTGPAGLLQTKAPLPGEGRNVIVNVVTAARADKGPKLRLIDADGGSGPPQLVKPGTDPIAIWAKRYAGTLRDLVCDRPADVARYANLSSFECRLHPPSSHKSVFDAYGIEEALSLALEPCIALPGGGSVIIESTAAAITIDINAGGQPAARANQLAAQSIARELRVRNICGHILIDVIPAKNRKATLDLIRTSLTDDPVSPEVAGFTPLGMIEMTRKRERLSLEELLGTADRPDPAGLAYKALREAVRAAIGSGKPHAKISVPSAAANLLTGKLNGALIEAKELIAGNILVQGFDSNAPAQLTIETFA